MGIKLYTGERYNSNIILCSISGITASKGTVTGGYCKSHIERREHRNRLIAEAGKKGGLSLKC